MPRVTTTNLGLGTWLDGENPGAGSQTVLAANTGLNANWLLMDLAVGTEHTASGVHKTNVIDGPMLKTTAADGVTLELAGAPLVLRIKDLGVSSGKLAAAAVVAGKIAVGGISAANQFAAGVVDATALAANAVTTAKILDANVTTAKLADSSVTVAKFEYNEYIALLVQAGAADPSVTLLSNGLSGAIAWTRSGTGEAVGTLASEFTANKTAVLAVNQLNTWGHINGYRLTLNEVVIHHFNTSHALADNWAALVWIRVYP